MGTESLVEGGWEALNKAVEGPSPTEVAASQLAAEQQFDIDQAYLRCFSSLDGQVVLNHMMERYVLVNSYNPAVVNPDQHGHFLEGHRNMVLIIQQRMERAKLGNPVMKRIEL